MGLSDNHFSSAPAGNAPLQMRIVTEKYQIFMKKNSFSNRQKRHYEMVFAHLSSMKLKINFFCMKSLN
jgi:hypothetical protein